MGFPHLNPPLAFQYLQRKVQPPRSWFLKSLQSGIISSFGDLFGCYHMAKDSTSIPNTTCVFMFLCLCSCRFLVPGISFPCSFVCWFYIYRGPPLGQALGLQRGLNPGLWPQPAYSPWGQPEMEQEIIIQWGWVPGDSSLRRSNRFWGGEGGTRNDNSRQEPFHRRQRLSSGLKNVPRRARRNEITGEYGKIIWNFQEWMKWE